MIKHMAIVVVVFGVLVLAWLAYEYYFSKPVVLVSNSLVTSTKSTMGLTSNTVNTNHDTQIAELLVKPNLSAIIIIADSADTTAQLLCGNSIHERTIIVLPPSSEHIDTLFLRWSLFSHYQVPYTLIVQGGRIIFQSFGTFCSY